MSLLRLRPEYIGPFQGLIAGSLAFLGRLDEARAVLERAGVADSRPALAAKSRPGCGRKTMPCGARACGWRRANVHDAGPSPRRDPRRCAKVRFRRAASAGTQIRDFSEPPERL